MNKRKYLLIKAWSYILIIVILAAILYTQKPDEIGFIFGNIIFFILCYQSYSSFKELKKTKESEKIYSPPSEATIPEKISYYYNILLFGIPSFLILSIWIYIDLKDFHAGKVDSLRTWEPILLIYKYCGYWYAILVTPLLGIISTTSLFIKIRNLKKNKF